MASNEVKGQGPFVVTGFTEALNKLSEASKVTSEQVAKLIAAVEVPYQVGQRIQFYRKGYAEKGEKDPTIAINGTIRSIDQRRGWLHVEHRWGTAVVKIGEEKVSVLQHSKKENPTDLIDHEEVKAAYNVKGVRTGRSSV